ncbi:MAG: hypothetical protein ACYC6Y_27260 [Thermoguttaceae bacterium]
MEFFKDEALRRCGRCRHLFPNPKISLGCAQWCDYAEQCVGSKAERSTMVRDGEFAGRILNAASELLRKGHTCRAPALLVFQHARELAAAETCKPLVVLAVALVIELEAAGSTTAAYDQGVGPDMPHERPTAEHLIGQLGMDEKDIHDVHGVLERFRHRLPAGDNETMIVTDAVSLAQLAMANSRGDLEKVKDEIVRGLNTQAGRERARRLFESALSHAPVSL